MNITVLAENVSDIEGIEAQHGLSLYIESGGKKMLFDMGQDGLFAKNAQVLKKDISAVDIAVISHGHYDHGGGLAKFLEMNDKAPVYINSRAFEPHYNANNNYIGLDTDLQNSHRFIYTDDITVIDDELTLFPGKAIDIKEPLQASGLSVMTDGKLL
ncbi:MAG: MBL fold metallo-hydrolase, partial [Clostridia bacterium]|nr:MBL fold metallo-hydrolase [Clostridia bacterium]